MSLTTRFSVLLIAVVFLSGQDLLAQNDSAQSDQEQLATVSGSFSLPEGLSVDLKWVEFKPAIVEKIELETPPFPDDWANRTVAQRNKWLTEFSQSEAGKKFQAEQEAKMQARKVFPIDIDANGHYKVYDVPPNNYVIEGALVKETDGARYRLSCFGEFQVGQVNEVELGNLDLVADRVFLSGDKAPEISAKQLNGQPWKLSENRSSYILLEYWASSFESAEIMSRQIKQAQADLKGKYPIKFVSISLDESQAKAKEFVQKNNIGWTQLYAGSWQHPSVAALGVRTSPSFWLIDPQGKIALTNLEIMQRYGNSQSLSAVLQDYLSGKNELAPND